MDHAVLPLSVLFVSGYAIYLRLLFWAVHTACLRGTEVPDRSSPSDVRTAPSRPAQVLDNPRTDGYQEALIAPPST